MHILPNRQKDFLFEAIIGGMDKTMQATLRQMYNQTRINDMLIRQQEMEQIKREVAEYVMSHMTATLDVSDIVDKIEDLRQSIDSLGK